MLKLYMVIYLGKIIVGFVGPLPYDLAECEDRVAHISYGHEDEMAAQGVELKCKHFTTPPLIEIQDDQTNS